jgi:L-methionine (R)-S-oxide reductase
MMNASELVKDLQTMRDEGFLSDALLRRAVKSIGGSDDRFNWVAAFLLREGGESLWLHNYVGEPAQYAEFQVGEGVGGTAAAKKENQSVADVSKLEGYTPCGPDVHSELVVLIRAGDEIFGEINIASEDASAFTGEDEAAVQAVCDKLAEQIASEHR